MIFPPNKRSWRGPGGIARGLDSVTVPKSVSGSWPLRSPVVSHVSRGLQPFRYQESKSANPPGLRVDLPPLFCSSKLFFFPILFFMILQTFSLSF